MVKGDLPNFCCSLKFGNKKKHFICTLKLNSLEITVSYTLCIQDSGIRKHIHFPSSATCLLKI